MAALGWRPGQALGPPHLTLGTTAAADAAARDALWSSSTAVAVRPAAPGAGPAGIGYVPPPSLHEPRKSSASGAGDAARRQALLGFATTDVGSSAAAAGGGSGRLSGLSRIGDFGGGYAYDVDEDDGPSAGRIIVGAALKAVPPQLLIDDDDGGAERAATTGSGGDTGHKRRRLIENADARGNDDGGMLALTDGRTDAADAASAEAADADPLPVFERSGEVAGSGIADLARAFPLPRLPAGIRVPPHVFSREEEAEWDAVLAREVDRRTRAAPPQSQAPLPADARARAIASQSRSGPGSVPGRLPQPPPQLQPHTLALSDRFVAAGTGGAASATAAGSAAVDDAAVLGTADRKEAAWAPTRQLQKLFAINA